MLSLVNQTAQADGGPIGLGGGGDVVEPVNPPEPAPPSAPDNNPAPATGIQSINPSPSDSSSRAAPAQRKSYPRSITPQSRAAANVNPSIPIQVFDPRLRQIVPMVVEGATISFDGMDYSICQFEPGPITATGTYNIPAGQTAVLVVSFYRVNPPPPDPPEYTNLGIVSGSGTFSVTGQWPGIQPGDPVVEIHFGANLEDPADGTPLPIGAGRDVYWYPWVCEATPTTPAPTTSVPTTAVPTTPVPTTPVPTTPVPTTAVPTTAVPTTPVPTTAVPTTPVPTTAVPPTATITPPPPPGEDPTRTPTITNTTSPTVPPPPGDSPTNTPTTPVNLTPAKSPTPGGGVIVPVTGADQSNPASLESMLIYVGLFLLGVGLVTAGINKRLFKTNR